MDSRQFITSCTENMEDSTNDSDCVSQQPLEEVDSSSTRILNENLPSFGEGAPENECLPSLSGPNGSGKYSTESPIPSSKIPNVCSPNEDALITPRQQLIPSSMSVLEGFDGSNAKTHQKELPPFAAGSDADFASPPQQGTTPENRWLSKNPKETNTPTPEKRCAETDENSTAVKRLKETPESDSDKHGTETEYTPKLGHSEVSETFYKSLINLHLRQMNIAPKELESPKSSATPFKNKRKITRNSSVESKSAIDTTASNSISLSSPASIGDKFPSNLQMFGSKVDQSAGESSNEIKTIFGDPLAESNSLETLSNNPDLLQTANSLLLSKAELESMLDVLKDSSKDVVLKPGLPVGETESTVHRHASNKTSRRASKAQISKVEGFESNIKVKKIQNRSENSTLSSTTERKSRSHSKKLSSLICRTIHRRSASDETLSTRNLNAVQAGMNQSTSAIRSQSKQAQTSRSLPDISKSTSGMVCIGKPLFREMLPKSPSNTAPATSNPREFSHSCRSDRPLASNELSASRNDPERQVRHKPNAALLQKRHTRFFPADSSTSRNATSPPYINVFEGQASTSGYQPIMVGSSLGQAFASRNQPGETGHGNSMHNNLSQAQPYIFMYQPITGGLFHGPPSLLTSRNEPAREELSAARDRSSTDDSSSSDDTPDSSDSTNTSEVQPEKHPEYVAQAQQILLSVLKEIMMHDGENCQWFLFEKSFRRISKSSSEIDHLNLIADLNSYLAERAYTLFRTVRFINLEMEEMHLVSVYGQLTVIVLDFLSYTLRVGSSRDFFRLCLYHSRFTSLYNEFLIEWRTFSLERIRCEATRNRVKTLREMIQRLLLLVLMAFRLLLMYVGENLSGRYYRLFDMMLSGENKIYFRRNLS